MNRHRRTQPDPHKVLGAAILLPGICVLALTLGGCTRGTEVYVPGEENLRARESFRDAKFGLLFQWGLYSLPGGGTGVAQGPRALSEGYEALAEQFNPLFYEPTFWVDLAEAAGARYLAVTVKHHDGFAMFDSAGTDWDIVDRTPFARDVIGPLAEECRGAGLPLFLHYSQLDRHNADFNATAPRAASGARGDSERWRRYIDFTRGQLRELLTNYGPIAGIRLGGSRERPDADWGHEETYAMLHRLQPRALIASDHGGPRARGEDFEIRDPRSIRRRDRRAPIIDGVPSWPVEIVETINDSPTYVEDDTNFKSTRELIHALIRASGRGANLLLAIGPKPDGTVPPEFIRRLNEMGRWLDRFGESIYGTRAGPLSPGPWGASVRKEDKVFLHYLRGEPGVISFPVTLGDLRTAYLFNSGAEIDVEVVGDQYLVKIPSRVVGAIDTVIVLEFAS